MGFVVLDAPARKSDCHQKYILKLICSPDICYLKYIHAASSIYMLPPRLGRREALGSPDILLLSSRRTWSNPPKTRLLTHWELKSPTLHFNFSKPSFPSKCKL